MASAFQFLHFITLYATCCYTAAVRHNTSILVIDKCYTGTESWIEPVYLPWGTTRPDQVCYGVHIKPGIHTLHARHTLQNHIKVPLIKQTNNPLPRKKEENAHSHPQRVLLPLPPPTKLHLLHHRCLPVILFCGHCL